MGLQQFRLRLARIDRREEIGSTFSSSSARSNFRATQNEWHHGYQKGKSEVSNRAYGHTREGEKFVETDQSSTSATLGDGGIYTSLEDLAKWDDALLRHTLLSEKEMQPALTPAKLRKDARPAWPANSDRPAGTPVAYGFGWFLDPYRGHPRMWHYGDTMGFDTYIVRFTSARDAHLTVVVLANRTDLDPESLAGKVADLYLQGE
jgi:CubicO group peptidase (beta-lactamase class C family)